MPNAKIAHKNPLYKSPILQELLKMDDLTQAIVAEGPSSAQREASVQAAEKDNDAKKAAREHAAFESEAAIKELGRFYKGFYQGFLW